MHDYMRGFIHDIKSALGIIITCLEETGLTFAQKVEMIDRQSKNALQLVDQLSLSLDGVSAAPGIIEVAEVRGIFDELAKLFPSVRVRFSCHRPGRLLISADSLRRVLSNCIANSLGAGRSKWVLLCCDQPEEGDDVLVLHVKDGGCGMTRKQISRIGAGFSTTGGGMGTRIARELLAAAGGSIEWDSIVDVGTCVTICLRTLPNRELPVTGDPDKDAADWKDPAIRQQASEELAKRGVRFDPK
jgi:signal transduction histidine kinase